MSPAPVRGRRLYASARRALFPVMGVAALAAAPLPAAAQAAAALQAAQPFDIPAQALIDALRHYSRQTGVQVVFASALGEGRRSSPVSGEFSAPQALGLLLAGTGLLGHFTGEHTATLEPAPALPPGESPALQLGTLRVPGRLADAAGAAGPGAGSPGAWPSLYGHPGSAGVVTREDLDRFRGSSPGDMFKSVPGVLSAASRNGASMDVNLRGAQGQNRVKVAVDGTQQSTSTWRGYYGVDERVYVDPDLVASVRIDKGPTGGADGAGIVGGVVSVRTLKAADIVKPGERFGVRVRAGVQDNAIAPPSPLTMAQRTRAPDLGDLENGWGSVVWATVQDDHELLVGATRRRAGNYFAGTRGETHYTAEDFPYRWPLSFTKPGEEVFNSSQDASSALLKGTLRWGGSHSLELGYMRYDNEFGEVMPSVLSTQDDAFRQVEQAHAGVDTWTARYRYDPGLEALDLRASLWSSNVEATTRSVGPALYFPQFGIVPADDPRHSETRTHGVDISNTARLAGEWGPGSLTYGASYSLEDADGRPYLSRLYTRDHGVLMHPSVGTREIRSVFSQATLQAGERLGFGAGLRYDAYRLHDRAAPGTSVVGDYADRRGERFSPSASVTVGTWAGGQAWLLHAQGMRPPSLRESTGSDSLLYPNPRLRPEIARNWGAGLNHQGAGGLRRGDRVQGKLALFRNRYRDYISRVYTTPDMGTQAVFTTTNLARAEFAGYELSAAYESGRFFAQAAASRYRHFEFCRRAAGCESQTVGADYALNQSPPRYWGSLTLGVRGFGEALAAGARINRTGPRLAPLTLAERQRTGYWLPGTVVDAFGRWRVHHRLAVDLQVENLSDRYYVDALQGSMPSPGRTVRLGFTFAI